MASPRDSAFDGSAPERDLRITRSWSWYVTLGVFKRPGILALMRDLDGVDVKLARAQHHLAELTRQVDGALAVSGSTLTRVVEEGPPPRLVYRVHGIPVEPESS